MARVLVPLAVLAGESVPAGVVKLLGELDVTVLGYQELPEQTPTDQARDQFEERALDALDDTVTELEAAGAQADRRLVFTHDREQTVRRIADETGSTAILLGGPAGDIDSVLVSLSGEEIAIERILTFVEALVGGRDLSVTLFCALPNENDEPPTLAEAASRLADAGIDVHTVTGSGRPFDALLDAVPGHDAVVLGERAPSLRSRLFGDQAEHVAAAAASPVLVVRRPDGGGSDTDGNERGEGNERGDGTERGDGKERGEGS